MNTPTLLLLVSITLTVFEAAGKVQAAGETTPKVQPLAGGASKAAERQGADEKTLALWLFDETQYINAALLDASQNMYDLRLLPDPAAHGTWFGPWKPTGGLLAPGKWGNALRVDPKQGPAVAWNHAGQSLVYPPINPVEARPVQVPLAISKALAGGAWTWEFWLNLEAVPTEEAAIIDMGAGKDAWFQVTLGAGASSLRLQSNPAGVSVRFPLAAKALPVGEWRHIALVGEKAGGLPRLFVDGKEAGAPVAEPVPAGTDRKFTFSIGRRSDGSAPLDASLDEMRLSSVARYKAAFSPPTTFSRNYATDATPPAKPTGPPLLFDGGNAPEVTALGSRRHVFLDGVLLQELKGAKLAVNPPRIEELTLGNDKPWEANGSKGGGITSGYDSVIDHDGLIHIVYSNHGMWTGQPMAQCLALSQDGQYFVKPLIGTVTYDDNTANNIIFGNLPCQGSFFKDPNPLCPPAERFKFTAFHMFRGLIVYTSPDLIHWRRNETSMLPVDCGGEPETFWDDQRGEYISLIRHEGFFVGSPVNGGLRAAGLAHTAEILKPWPFEPSANPKRRDVMTTATLQDELPVPIFKTVDGEVYRSRPSKYVGAPDAYLAFAWRLNVATDCRRTELGVSRDGRSWSFYGASSGNPPYVDVGWKLKSGLVVKEAIALHGLIYRGDEVWQYVAAKTVPHDDANPASRVLRLVQRRDGFVCVDATGEVGLITTKPFTFAGRELVVNAISKGGLRAALLGQDGRELPGFGLADCEVFQGDAVNAALKWRGGKSVEGLAGKTVRLRVELKDAKLFAFQFRDPVPDVAPAPRAFVGAVNVLAKAPTPFVLAAEGGQEMTFEITKQPTLGKLTGTSPNLIYTPPAGEWSEDRLDYRVTIGGRSSEPAAVVFTRCLPAVAELVPVSVTSVSTAKGYRLLKARPNTKIFIDRAYITDALPSGLSGGWLLQTSNDDDHISKPSHVVLHLDQDADIWLFVHEGATKPLSWMDAEWKLMEVGSSAGAAGKFRAWRRHFAAGEAALGGNERGSSGALSNWFAVIEPTAPAAQK
ncbi:hypothetical protein BH09VER1_BH09VER1_55190 [soil metagenome]